MFRLWNITAGGVSFDRTKAQITFTMPARNVSVEATYRNKNQIKTAVVPANAFSGKYAANTEAILDYLIGLDADVLALARVDYDRTLGYNSTVDVVPALLEALGDLYCDSYFAPVWDKAETTTDAGVGYLGHLILSRVPITSEEVMLQNKDAKTNAKSTEDRGIAKVQLNVDGTTLDVFVSHFAHNNTLSYVTQWVGDETYNGLKDYVLASTADSWILMGDYRWANVGYSGATRLW